MIEQFDVSTSYEARVATIALSGELDIASEVGFIAAVKSVVDSPGGVDAIVIDLTSLSFCDSSGVRSLIGAQRLAEEAGIALAIVPPVGEAADALVLAGVAERLPLTDAEAPASV
jgi:anti-sigma B factor antagonist